jgi:hypothetical protein
MTPATCIGEPVSWLRLEQLALGELAAPAADAVATHLTACAACAACLDQLRADHVELPALPAPAPVRAPWWRRRAVWGIAGTLAAAAAALIIFLRMPRTAEDADVLSPRIRIKGAGDVVVGLVRERGGETVTAPTGFRPGDRFKLIVTCGEATDVWVDIVVFQPERAGAPLTASYPAEPMRLACGNHVALPGAFTLTGTGAASVCLALDVDRPPTRERLGRRKGIACYQLRAE